MCGNITLCRRHSVSDSKEGGGRDGRGRVGRGVPGPGCLDFGVRGLGDRCLAAAKAARHPVKGHAHIKTWLATCTASHCTHNNYHIQAYLVEAGTIIISDPSSATNASRILAGLLIATAGSPLTFHRNCIQVNDFYKRYSVCTCQMTRPFISHYNSKHLKVCDDSPKVQVIKNLSEFVIIYVN